MFQIDMPSRIGDGTHRVLFCAKGEEGTIHHRNGIVVKDCRHIFRREFVRRVGDQETGLSNSTIPHNHTPDSMSAYQFSCSSGQVHRLYRRDNHSFVVVGEET